MHRIITTTLAALVLGGACVGLGATAASASPVEAPRFFGIELSTGSGLPTASGSVTILAGTGAAFRVLAEERGVVTIVDEAGRVLCEDAGRSNPYTCVIEPGALAPGQHDLHAQVRLGGANGAVGTSDVLHVQVGGGDATNLGGGAPGSGSGTPGVGASGTGATGSGSGTPGTGAGTGAADKPSMVEGGRTGKQIGVLVTLPKGVASTVRVLDARGETVVDERVVGTGRAVTYLLDAPFGKTRTYVVSVTAGADRLTQQFTFAFGGPKI